jgi:beta-aspartyl-peptidase (threonine type)
MTPSIIVHGGAGGVEDARRAQVVTGCELAARAGWKILAEGGRALDAVEAAVRVLEDDGEFNAGYGAALNRLGIVEVDASIMDGRLRAGAVAAVPWMRHPVTLARHLLEAGEHVLLAGGGALLYAREHGLPAGDPPDSMISPRARARHQSTGTVGACAADASGSVAAATSTGGTAGKRPGRVGDSPLVGAGTFADDEGGAASATGHGESILRVCMTRFAVDLLRGGPRRCRRRARRGRRGQAPHRRPRRHHPRRSRRRRRPLLGHAAHALGRRRGWHCLVGRRV